MADAHQGRARHRPHRAGHLRRPARGRPGHPPAGAHRRRRGALDLLHLRHHLGPQGRPAHRPHPDRRRPRPGRRRQAQRRRHRLDRLPVLPHRRPRLPHDPALPRAAARCSFEAFKLDEAVELFARKGVTMAGGGPAFYQMYLAEQRTQPGTPIIPSLRLLSGGGAPKPPEMYTEVKEEMGIPVCHGYGMTECPMIAQGGPDDTDGPARLHRRGAGHRHRDPHRHPRRRGGAAGRRRRGPGEGPDGVQGLHRPGRSTPRPSTTTAGSAPATSATSTPTATSCSPAGSRTSSSARARTSRPRRSRTCSTSTRRWATSP